MNIKVQLACLYSGLAGIVLFGVGLWLLAGMVPPPSPHDSALEIQRFYADNTDGIRIGLLVVMVSGALTGPWVAVISTQMKRIEGPSSPLAYTQLGMGMLGVLLFIMPTLMMQAVAFRPNRDPQLMQLVNDMAWLPFIGVFALALVQGLAIAGAIFLDKDEEVFPRWLGYFNIWVVLLFVPAGLIYFFKTGAFAWNGLFCFWVPAAAFGGWFAVMFPMLRRAILSQAVQSEPAEDHQLA